MTVAVAVRRLAAAWSILAAAALPTPARAAADPFEGLWVTSNFASVVEIRRCEASRDASPDASTDASPDASLCAELVWLWDVGVARRRKLDEKNPDEGRRDRPMIGSSLFERFRPDGDAWKGRIYNPEDGRTYRATLRRRSADALRLRGCYGPFCRSQTWRRLGSFTLPTPADLGRRRAAPRPRRPIP